MQAPPQAHPPFLCSVAIVSVAKEVQVHLPHGTVAIAIAKVMEDTLNGFRALKQHGLGVVPVVGLGVEVTARGGASVATSFLQT